MIRLYFIIGFLSAVLFMLLVSSTYQQYPVLHIGESYIDFKNNSWYLDLDENDRSKIKNLLNLETRSRLVTNTIIKYSIKYDVPLTLAFSLAKNESNFRIRLKSLNSNKTYDYGLFQLNSGYRKNWTISEFFNIDKNINEGIRYLKSMLDENDTIDLALASYNAGPTRVRNKYIPYSTFNYISKIRNWKEYIEQKIRLINIK